MLKSLFSMRIFLSILAMVLVAVMLKLGFWQLDRSQFKAIKQMTFNQRVSQDIKQLPSDLIAASDWSYFKVKVSGQYLPDSGFFVDNVVHQSATGLSVVTPLKIIDSEILILVNRGWMPWGTDRTFLPAITTPKGTIELSGLLIPATEGHFYLNNPDQSNERSELWLQLDLPRFERTVDNQVQPMILILDSGQPGAYEYIWQLQDDSWVARHKAYAFQWIALAFSLFLVTLILNFKSMKGAQHG